MTAPSRRGRARALADCVTCGAQGPAHRDTPAVARRWASEHAEQHPGHQAHVITETVRVYELGATGMPRG